MVVERDALIDRLRAIPATAPSLRAERKRISKELAALDRAAVLGLAHHLIAARIARFVAYELVLSHRGTMERITPKEVLELGEGLARWGDIDAFSCFVAGPAWRARRIPDRLVRGWARSADWAWRRVALVSTVPLNSRSRGGAGDAERTLMVCALLVSDRDPLVVKALSWALRELAKRDPESVRRFLVLHRAELHARVIREVGCKLKTGRKAAVTAR